MSDTPTDYREWNAALRWRLALGRAGVLHLLVGFSEQRLNAPLLPGGSSCMTILRQRTAVEQAATLSLLRLLTATNSGAEGVQVPADDIGRYVQARATLLDILAAINCRTDIIAVTAVEIDSAVQRTVRLALDGDRDDMDLIQAMHRPLAAEMGPKLVLRAALRATRKALLTAVALLPPDQVSVPSGMPREATAPILAELARHDCERGALIVQTVDLDAGKRGQAAGSPPAGDDWRLIWTQLHSFRQHLLFLLEQVNEADLSRRPAARPDISLYGLFAAAVEDDWRAAHAVGTLTGESVSCDL